MRKYYVNSIFILCFVGIVIYSNTFNSSFHFDDFTAIVSNLRVRHLAEMFTTNRSLTFLSFTFNYYLNGLNVFGYHLFNLIVHLGAAIMIWWFVILTLSMPAMKRERIANHSGLIALFTGLVFVTHPIQTQAVTYIVQRATSMATLFYLASMNLYIKSRLLKYEKRGEVIQIFCYLGSLITGGMAMLSKETAATLPLMIIFYEFCFIKEKKDINWKPLIFFILVSVFFVILGARPEALLDTLKNLKGAYQWRYLLTQFRVMVTYIRLFFIPANQNLDYDYPIAKGLMAPSMFASIFLLVVILLVAIRIFSKYRLVSFGIFWFFIASLPYLIILPVKDVIAEHKLYLPMVGCSIFLVAAIYYLFSYIFNKKAGRKLIAVLCAVIAVYSVLTYKRNFVWKDEFTLWNDVVHKSPHKARAYNNRGFAYVNKGDLESAIADFSRAIQIQPDDFSAYNNLANIYDKKGSLDEAIAYYTKAIKINPHNAEIYNNRANMYAKKDNLNGAIADYTKALRINRKAAKAYNNRGRLYQLKGNLEDAIADYTKAIQINPDYGVAYNNRAVAYFFKQEYDKSLEDIRRAEELGESVNPEFREELNKALEQAHAAGNKEK